jgi:Prion-inhibition and propagation
MPFEPISGTIGAVALIDPALRGASWVYAKYKLGKNFGEHYQALTITYTSEAARFVQIRDQKIDVLPNNPLNESETFLNNALRDRLILEVKAFEECEKLMEKYSKKAPKEKDDEYKSPTDVAQQSTPSGNQGDCMQAMKGCGNNADRVAAISIVQSPNTMTDSTVPSSAASQNRLSVDAASSGMTLGTPSRSGSILTLGFKFHRPRMLRRQKEKNTLPTTAAQQVQAASADLQDDRTKLEESHKEQQIESTLGERANWAIGDCDRFKQLVKELTGHNDYFISIIQLRTSKNNEHHEFPAPSAQVTHAASHLRRLIRSLAATRESSNIFFQMMLHDNPFDFHSLIGNSLPATALLRPSSSMFAFQLKKASSDTQTLHQNDNVALLFEVPSSDGSSEDVDKQIENERPRIESFAGEFISAESLGADGEDPDRKPWWAAIGTIKDVVSPPQPSKTAKSIAVFHDRMTYTQSKTLWQSFTDSTESKIMEKTYLIFRVHLAYILASSFTYFVSAGYPLDYSSKSLRYYSDSKTNPQLMSTLQLAQMRKSPYVQLRAVGASHFPGSFSSILADAMETASDAQIIVQKLGVLLFEVGVWNPVSSAEDWRSLCAAARIRKVELLKCATTGYFNVVHACLEFATRDTWTTGDQVAWLNFNIVQPLRRIFESLPLEFQLT